LSLVPWKEVAAPVRDLTTSPNDRSANQRRTEVSTCAEAIIAVIRQKGKHSLHDGVITLSDQGAE
jgi:hypothetical protein